MKHDVQEIQHSQKESVVYSTINQLLPCDNTEMTNTYMSGLLDPSISKLQAPSIMLTPKALVLSHRSRTAPGTAGHRAMSAIKTRHSTELKTRSTEEAMKLHEDVDPSRRDPTAVTPVSGRRVRTKEVRSSHPLEICQAPKRYSHGKYSRR